MNIIRHSLRIVTVLFFLSMLAAEAQTDDALARLRQWAKQAAVFSLRCPQEKVYLHFDNTAYFQGEVIYYKAYVVSAGTLSKPLSSILYVELLSPTGVVLKQQKLKIENGCCHGSLSLTDESVPYARSLRGMQPYPSGYYEVRAYTREMQNFDANTLFSRIFPVYEKPEKEGDFDHPVLKNYKTDIEARRPKMEKTDKVNADFYPEGGNMVIGIPCQVAFRVYDNEGMPLQASGTVEERTAFSTFHDGMGVFEFTPQKKNNKAEISYDGKSYSFDLPKAEKEGYSLSVNTLKKDVLIFSVSRSESTPVDLLGYTLMCREKVLLFDTLTAALPVTRVHSLQDYPSGVYQLTLFNQTGKRMAERLFFVNRPVASSIQANIPDRPLQPFEKITLPLSLTGEQGTPVGGTFSLAVRDGGDYGTLCTGSADIGIDMLLSSDLKGYIHRPSYYFEADDPSHRRALDLLMRVQGWRRYEWQKMAGSDPFPINYYLEQGITLDGQVLSRIRKKPIADVEVSFIAHNADRTLKQQNRSVTDSLGRFGFQLADFTGEWNITLDLRNDENKPKDARILIVRSQKPAPQPYFPYALHLPEHSTLQEVYDVAFGDSLVQKSDGSNRQPEIISPDAVQLKEVVITERRKYIDYCTFKAFDCGKATEEVLDMGSYTPKVIDYLQDLGYSIYMDPEYLDSSINLSPVGMLTDKYIYASLPVYRMKGGLIWWQMQRQGKWKKILPVDNPWAVDMENVKSVIVYDSPMAYQSLPFIDQKLVSDAMDSFKTRRMYVIQLIPYDANESPLFDKGRRNTTLSGFSQVKEFFNPSYADGVIRGETDYRRTLYWNPDVTIDSTGRAIVEFYNNSRCKQFSVSAQGFTDEGVPVSNRQ